MVANERKQLTNEVSIKAGVDYPGVCVVFYCHDGKGNWLFHKRSATTRDEQGAWDNGGGKLEFGETIRDGLFRELKEEYGCEGVVEVELPAITILREHEGRKTHWVAHGAIIRVNPAEVILGDPESMVELGWFPLSALPEPLHQGSRIQLTQYHQLFEKYLKEGLV